MYQQPRPTRPVTPVRPNPTQGTMPGGVPGPVPSVGGGGQNVAGMRDRIRNIRGNIQENRGDWTQNRVDNARGRIQDIRGRIQGGQGQPPSPGQPPTPDQPPAPGGLPTNSPYTQPVMGLSNPGSDPRPQGPTPPPAPPQQLPPQQGPVRQPPIPIGGGQRPQKQNPYQTPPTIPQTPQMPAYAMGRVTNGPEFALIGEQGPEMVLPLTKPDAASRVMSQAADAMGIRKMAFGGVVGQQQGGAHVVGPNPNAPPLVPVPRPQQQAPPEPEYVQPAPGGGGRNRPRNGGNNPPQSGVPTVGPSTDGTNTLQTAPDPNMTELLDRLRGRMGTDPSNNAIGDAQASIADATTGRQSQLQEQLARGGNLGSGIATDLSGRIAESGDRNKAMATAQIKNAENLRQDNLAMGSLGAFQTPFNQQLAGNQFLLNQQGQQFNQGFQQQQANQGQSNWGAGFQNQMNQQQLAQQQWEQQFQLQQQQAQQQAQQAQLAQAQMMANLTNQLGGGGYGMPNPFSGGSIPTYTQSGGSSPFGFSGGRPTPVGSSGSPYSSPYSSPVQSPVNQAPMNQAPSSPYPPTNQYQPQSIYGGGYLPSYASGVPRPGSGSAFG